MTLKHLEDFRNQIQAQVAKHATNPIAPGQELMFHLGAIELQVGVNLINQLIIMEQGLILAPPGATGPEI